MHPNTLAEWLWGHRAKVSYLLIAAIILLLTFLSGREIWTQEHRWADIVSGMFYRHDFFHPFLNENNYYDKPLLSYWLIAAVASITGQLSLWAMRLPSALAGLLAIWSIYRIGVNLKDKRLGLLAGWLLLTTFYFIFWAKTSSADMLNMAGSLFAVSWYFEKKYHSTFFDYMIFFLILALTALCKGLVGVIVPLLAIFPDVVMEKSWKKYLRLNILLSAIPALIVYVLPFWASSHFSNAQYHENGLYLVYRENILRYFQPFDHKDPIYTYFIFLPLYLMPWAIFFIPALFSLKSRWSQLTKNSQWIIWATLLLFLFFTLSGSRRSYYVLPIVPFAILLTADWILDVKDVIAKRLIWTARLIPLFFIILFLNFDIVQPLYYAAGGVSEFATKLKREANQIRPWSQWNFVMLDAESKLRFYLQLSPDVKNLGIEGSQRQAQTLASLKTAWPVLNNKQNNVIFISRKGYEPLLRVLLPHYKVVSVVPNDLDRFFKRKNVNTPIAFIPQSSL